MRPRLGVLHADDLDLAIRSRYINSAFIDVPLAKQPLLPQADVEAWPRSYDPKKPGEINRVVRRPMADLDLTTSPGQTSASVLRRRCRG